MLCSEIGCVRWWVRGEGVGGGLEIRYNTTTTTKEHIWIPDVVNVEDTLLITVLVLDVLKVDIHDGRLRLC